MKKQFKDHEEFFGTVGDQYLQPTQFGECFWPITVEEMYQHFKARLDAERKGGDDTREGYENE